MRPFKYVRASDPMAAARAVAANPHAKFLAGGTNLLDLMKEDVERPSELVDLTRLKLTQIKATRGGVSIGALATNTDTANHPLIRRDYPLLAQAIVAGASGQLRNMATNGGNLLQRTRCPYFYDTAMPCNKREPGTGCGAREGLNRMHAILGWSEKCVATYPGDMANALYALDAVVTVRGADGRERTIRVDDFHRLPNGTPERDTNLKHGDPRDDDRPPEVELREALLLPQGSRPHVVRLCARRRRGRARARREHHPAVPRRAWRRGPQALAEPGGGGRACR